MDNPSERLPDELTDRLAGKHEGIQKAKMSKSDREFLYGLVRKIKPVKCLEVGIQFGGSSAIILEALADNAAAVLYSNDIVRDYVFNEKKSYPGFMIEQLFPEYLSKYKTYLGKDISYFIEEIGGEIDFALIDTAHKHPCETLNFLTVLPFMKPDSWVAFHDIGLFYCRDDEIGNIDNFATKYIYDVWQGERICSDKCERYFLPNIGAVKVENLQDNIPRLLSILFNRWDMNIYDNILAKVREIICKYYSSSELDYYDLVVQRKRHFKEFMKE